MNESKTTVLIVDDHQINRAIITKILSEKYNTIEAENGKVALEKLKENPKIGVVLLDIVMPVMDGYEFLEELKKMDKSSLPVIVMTAQTEEQAEEHALELGALDFVVKPIKPKILLKRVYNAVIRNQMMMLEQQKYIMTHNMLTGLYNHEKLYEATRDMVEKNKDKKFAFIELDIDKFRMYSSSMGEDEGNKLIVFVSELIENIADKYGCCTYGHMNTDVFCMCQIFDEKRIEEQVRYVEKELHKYREDYVIDISFGVYILQGDDVNIDTAYFRASMAADKCKKEYGKHLVYYDESMNDEINREQIIANEMQEALNTEQFKVFLQPKYDLKTELPCGAEALVRWFHPEKGMISPGAFIPVFEKNGFIAKLDYYMWEHVCMLLSKWKKAGKEVYPVSVNISRVSLYNPRLCDLILGLVKKYDILPSLLELEVTESAYMSNPEMMERTIGNLQKNGFIILMDDFGSGYSSLNTLKQIDVDILKIDMKFMPNGENDKKSEIILSSIVRMAAWLDMPVIAEGVETKEQKEFLASIGCNYVQGYYFAKPMPVNDYEELISKMMPKIDEVEKENKEISSAVWSANAEVEEIMSGIDVPVAIIEYSDTKTQILRVNKVYVKEYGYPSENDFKKTVSKKQSEMVNKMFNRAISTGMSQECDVSYNDIGGKICWVRMKIKKLSAVSQYTILCCTFEDVTKEKTLESRWKKLVALAKVDIAKKKMLIIDDLEISRSILKAMFQNDFDIIEAENGKDGMELLRKQRDSVSVILLDMIMPKMNGQEFLDEKNRDESMADIPVVVISSESKSNLQLGMLKNGVNDYIIKPFDPEITKQRVENVISFSSRFKGLLKEYQSDLLSDTEAGEI